MTAPRGVLGAPRLWITLVGLWLVVGGARAHAEEVRPPVMAVVPFNYVQGPDLYRWMRGAAPAALADKLLALPDARVVDPAEVGAAWAARVPPGASIGRGDAQALAAAVGADAVLWGDIAKIRGDVRLDVYVSHVTSDIDSVRLSMSAPAEELVPLISQVALALAPLLGVEVDDDLAATLSRPAARDRYTLVLWGRTLSQLWGIDAPPDPELAKTTLLKTLRIDPRLASAWYTLASCHLALGDPDKATMALYETLRHRPDDAWAHRRLAYLYLAAGRRSEALRHLSELTLLEPEDARAHLDLAQVLSSVDRQPAALREAQLAVTAARGTPEVKTEALRLVGRYQGVAGNRAAMVEAYAALLERAPGDVEALTSLAAAALARGDVETVTPYAEALRAIDPRDPIPPHMVGEAALISGDGRVAVTAFHSEIAAGDAEAGAFRYLSRALTEAGYRGDALQALEQAALRSPKDPTAWNALGEALAATGDLDGAVEALRRAVELAPGWPSPHLDLGIALLRQGEKLAARQALTEALALDDRLAAAHYHLALLDVDASRLGAAAEHLRVAVALDPGLTDALYNLAVVLDLKGERASAASAFEAYLRAQPADPAAGAIEARITELRG